MLHQNFAHYIGQSISKVRPEIEEKFFGSVVVYSPMQVADASVKPSRLKVFVDEMGFITRIVNG